MKRQIHFWHGKSEALERKVNNNKHCLEENGIYYWNGSLDDFANIFPTFMLLKNNIIAITQYNNFNPR